MNAWSIPFLKFYSSIIIQEMKVLTNKVSDEQIWTWVTLFTESVPQSLREEVKQDSVSKKEILMLSLYDIHRDLCL